MKKGTFLAVIALLIAVAGAIVAFAAYFKRRSCSLCDDYMDDLAEDDFSELDYYATPLDEQEAPDAQPEPPAQPQQQPDTTQPAGPDDQ